MYFIQEVDDWHEADVQVTSVTVTMLMLMPANLYINH